MKFTLWLPAYQKETEVPGSEAELLGLSSCLVYKSVTSLKIDASTFFPRYIAKFLGTPTLKKIYERLLMHFIAPLISSKLQLYFSLKIALKQY